MCLSAGMLAMPGIASAMDVNNARQILQKVMAQHDVTATETSATSHDGIASFHYDNVHVPLGGYEGDRDLVMSNVEINVNDDKNTPRYVSIDFNLPEQASISAQETINQRNLTMHNARGTVTWNTQTQSPEGFTGFANFLGADEPVSRQHWLLSDLKISWLTRKVDLAWKDAEWTGPNREKMGAMKSAELSLYPDSDGTTRLDYAHDGMWLPGLFQPRTVRLLGHATGVKWTSARPILQQGLSDLLSGMRPSLVRNNIANALWHEALKTGKPIDVEKLYVESRNLEAAGTGQFVPQKNAAYGFQGVLDLDLVGREQLEYLLGTPKSPTILGALFPPAVDGLAAGTPGKQGTSKYKLQLLADGRITVNGQRVMNGPGR
ncbi:hypothetical protein TMES_07745 [Thalassospira mesophila]|uniref:DUF2125 domain-containing protein n=1 Tax=Thalassospira mesophila TaxID=1293891 RepID=A0A1Y2L381_9PROT|nr:hypothetical protein TMES_07745 [Thalassospira mesophila]